MNAMDKEVLDFNIEKLLIEDNHPTVFSAFRGSELSAEQQGELLI